MADSKKGIIQGAADDPVIENRLPHLKLALDSDPPQVFFLPGDPGRVKLFHEFADEFEIVSHNREFTVAFGAREGLRFGVCSTGIGGGSTEIAVVELARLGVKIMVRTGGCAALDETIKVGEVILNSGAVRWGGSSAFYAPPEYPAVADPFLLVGLAESCNRLGLPFHVGVVASVDSYYEGQGRSVAPTREPMEGTERLERLRRLGVLNIDMETETVFTIGSILGAKTANILAVHANRATNEWLADYAPAENRMVQAALDSLETCYELLS